MIRERLLEIKKSMECVEGLDATLDEIESLFQIVDLGLSVSKEDVGVTVYGESPTDSKWTTYSLGQSKFKASLLNIRPTKNEKIKDVFKISSATPDERYDMVNAIVATNVKGGYVNESEISFLLTELCCAKNELRSTEERHKNKIMSYARAVFGPDVGGDGEIWNS